MYTVTVNAPGTAEGEPIEVLFLGLVPNGSTIEVSEAQVEIWESMTGRTWPEEGHLDASYTPVYVPDIEDQPVVDEAEPAVEPEVSSTDTEPEGVVE